MSKIKTIEDIKLGEQKLEYKFQEQLTKKLDNYQDDFNQDILNEIVLWKVNRYALFDTHTIELLNMVENTALHIDRELTNKVLINLLNTKGVKLAMASTILRFKNPSIYQIIDQRVYRIIYGISMPTIKTSDSPVEFYLEYLEKLKNVCETHKIDFKDSDRILYVLDKEINSEVKIKY